MFIRDFAENLSRLRDLLNLRGVPHVQKVLIQECKKVAQGNLFRSRDLLYGLGFHCLRALCCMGTQTMFCDSPANSPEHLQTAQVLSLMGRVCDVLFN